MACWRHLIMCRSPTSFIFQESKPTQEAMATALPVCSTTTTTAAAASSTTSPSPPLPPKDVVREVQKEIRNLHSEDEDTVMKAAASLVMLSTLPEAEPHLVHSVQPLVSLFKGGYSFHVKRNACAALTAVMNTSPMLYLSVLEAPNLIAGLVECLSSGEDSALQSNVLAFLSVLAQQDQGLALIAEAEALDNIVSLLGTTTDARLEEELADTICALAYHEKLRPVLLQKGVVTKLAAHLKADSMEVCVRVLLALGMLCGSSLEGRLDLAKADGAVKYLLEMMKSNDHDIKSISRDLFIALTSDQQTRTVVEQMMRNA